MWKYSRNNESKQNLDPVQPLPGCHCAATGSMYITRGERFNNTLAKTLSIMENIESKATNNNNNHHKTSSNHRSSTA
jgi:hypothetical protein